MSSRLKRDRARAKLSQILAISDDRAFLQMIWCVDRLRTGDYDVGARGLTNLPPTLRRNLSENRLLIQPWILEDLTNEVLTVPKPKILVPRSLNCGSYEGFAHVYNAALAVDDAEAGFELENGRHVLQAMPRIAHRQFDWQQGWMNAPNLYRSAFIYGQGECEEWFSAQYGLSPAQLVLFALACQSVFRRSPTGAPGNFVVPELNLDQPVIDAALRLTAADLSVVRESARTTRRGPSNIAARPSVLRRTPVIKVRDNIYTTPLPELVLERATSGLYLDLVQAPSRLRDYIAQRFEQYALDLVGAVFPGEVRGDYGYGTRALPLRTPDILVGPTNGVQAIIECKATRMTFAARFSDDWHIATERGYGELAKGVGQIWRHCSHMRRNIVADKPAQDVVGLVLTLDPWMRMTHQQDEIILNRAREWCAEHDPLITAEDECPISFTHMADFEALLHRTDAAGVLQVLKDAATKIGWGMRELASALAVKEVQQPYLLRDRMAEVLPWFDRLGKDAEKAGLLARNVTS